MKINTSSWHYKLVTWFGQNSAPRTLCPYFWKGVWHAVVASSVAGFISLVGWGMGTDILAKILLMFGIVLSPVAIAVPGILFGWLICAIVVGVIGGIFWSCFKSKELIEKRKEDKKQAAIEAGTYKEPEPSIFKEFVKAKHRKVCPFLEFK